jgi:sugar-specific transcriptional regulator TrmB
MYKKDNHKNVISLLTDLGLSNHDALVYLIVLKHGEASAGDILDEAKLHREQVYRAIKRLEDDGLVNHYYQNKRSRYRATDPSIFIRQAKSKVGVAESVQTALKEIYKKQDQSVSITKGENCFQILLEDIVETIGKGGEYLVLGGVGDTFYELTKHFLPAYQGIFKKRNIIARIISQQTVSHTRELSTGKQFRVRQIEGEIGGPAATVIYANKVAIEVFDPENLAVIFIENEFIADAYRKTFETFWKMARVDDLDK